jgi:hypothetical protein
MRYNQKLTRQHWRVFDCWSRFFRSNVRSRAVPMEVRPPRKENCHGIVSPADPDARYNTHRGTGYLVQIMKTFAETNSQNEDESRPIKPHLITFVAVDTLTMHDQDVLISAIDDASRHGINSQVLLANSLMGQTTASRHGAKMAWRMFRQRCPPRELDRAG